MVAEGACWIGHWTVMSHELQSKLATAAAGKVIHLRKRDGLLLGQKSWGLRLLLAMMIKE